MPLVLYERKVLCTANNMKCHTRWMKVAEYQTRSRLDEEVKRRNEHRSDKRIYEYTVGNEI